MNIIIGRFFGSADLIVFATEAGLCKAHVKAWTTSFSAKNALPNQREYSL